MSWNINMSGTKAQVLAAVAAVTGSGSVVENAVLPGILTDVQNAINSWAAINPPSSIHVVMQGHADKTVIDQNLQIEAVYLDPQGRIIANAFPQIV